MTATHYESHAWGSGVDGDECVACGVTWQDCDEDCTRRPAPAHRAHTGMTTHENGDQTVNENGTGADLIAAERQRQVEQEGWTAEHDAEHDSDALVRAAVCYALPERDRGNWVRYDLWPWEERYWKPSPADRVRELVKAGALIAAEIDRLQTRTEAAR